MPIDLASALSAIDRATAPRVAGRVTELTGLVIRATAPGARTGELVLIERAQGGVVRAEVVGFQGEEVLLLPLGTGEGLGPDSVVRPTGQPFSIRCGDALLGRVLDALGEPLDGQGPLPTEGMVLQPVERAAPNPLERRRIDRVFSTGIAAIDGLLTLGEGQRIGLFSGPGLGKSTLLGQIAEQAAADVLVVGLVGERGREVRDFLEGQLDEPTRRRAVCVCATSDAPPLLRLKSALAATTIAEHFADQGRSVLLVLDSLTRVARAQREVGLAAGEPPTRHGYPPSVFAMLPRLLERAGHGRKAAITAIYAVLTGADDVDDPIAEEVRAILDGHLVLSPELAGRGHWPAIDVVRSLSRIMDQLVDDPHRLAALRMRGLLATYERQRELIMLGAYRPGSDPLTDQAIAAQPLIEGFLRQARSDRFPFDDSKRRLLDLLPSASPTERRRRA